MENKKVVLIVDDEQELRDLLAFEFEEAGYQVFTASNGREAFALVEKTPVDVLISDVRMPDGDGIELLEAIKARCATVPVVLLVTGFTDLAADEAYHRGADALLSKPVDLDTLREITQRMLLPNAARWRAPIGNSAAKIRVETQLPPYRESLASHRLNIGRGGMFVQMDSMDGFTVDQTVQFDLSFADGKWSPMKGVGVIRWLRRTPEGSAPAGIGIEFSSLDDSSIGAFTGLLTEMNPLPFIPRS